MKNLAFPALCALFLSVFCSGIQAQQPDPIATATDEAVRREALKRELDAKLVDAAVAEKRGAFVEASRLYTDSLDLVKRIGPGVEAQHKTALAGFIATRGYLAEMAQRAGDYGAADAQYTLMLKEDPKNEELKQLKAKNDELWAMTKGRRPSEADIAALGPIYTNQVQSMEMAQAGKMYFEAGKYDLAEARLRQALKLDPANPAADYYLKIITDKKMAASENAKENHDREAILAVQREWTEPGKKDLPVPNAYARTNFVRTSKAREKLYHKLDNIVLGDMTFDGLQLNQVIESLGRDAKNRDPDKKGINLIIAPNADPQSSGAPQVDPATGLPVAAAGGGDSDISATTIRIIPAVSGLTLHQMLDVIVKVADRPIKYSVEDFGVMFSLRGNETPALHTRWFRVDPNTFASGLQGVVALDFGGTSGGQGGGGGGGGRGGGGGGRGGGGGGRGGGNNQGGQGGQGQGSGSAEYVTVSMAASGGRRGGGVGGGGAAAPGGAAGAGGAGGQAAGINFLTAQTPQDITVTAVITYFRTAGVPLDPPKSVHFNDRLGLLMVRASLSDLDIIEQAVQVLNTIPPQVQIEAKMAEVGQDDNKALGFDWLLGNTLVLNGQAGLQGGTAPSFTGSPSTANPSGAFPGPIPPGSPPGTTVPGTVASAATDNVLTTGLRNSAPAIATLTGILTDPQFRLAIRALEQRQGVSFIASPKVVTPSGRQAQIKTVEIRSIITELEVDQTAGGGGGGNGLNGGGGGGVGSSILPIAEPFELGPTLDVVPYVSADGFTIQLTLIPTLKEFVGYDLVSGSIFSAQVQSVGGVGSATPPIVETTPLPIFRLRQVVTSAIVWDGQTIAIGGLIAEETTKMKDKVPMLGDLPYIGRLFRSESTMSKKKNLVIFVTPTIIDPAGNRVHTEEEMPFAQSAIPPQRSVNQPN